MWGKASREQPFQVLRKSVESLSFCFYLLIEISYVHSMMCEALLAVSMTLGRDESAS